VPDSGVCAASKCVEDGDERFVPGPDPSDEICDLLDNDCDGDTDESEEAGDAPLVVPCYTGSAETEGVGECVAGTRVCRDGSLGEVCEGEVRPVPESCANMGEDNDCNDEDDDITGLDEPCATGLFGICALGIAECDGDELVCTPDEEAGAETCLNTDSDDNCDGILDNVTGLGLACAATAPEAAPAECKVGELRCTGGEDAVCVATLAREPESCANQGFDDDCDGDPDDIAELDASCDSGEAGICAAGTFACNGDDPECVADNVPGTETCLNPGFDNDCDGFEDNVAGTGGECNTGLFGACATGVLACDDPAGAADDIVCEPLQTPAGNAGTTNETVCNEIDDDCDNSIDEGFLLQTDENNCVSAAVCAMPTTCAAAASVGPY
jgi:hypothetical protein